MEKYIYMITNNINNKSYIGQTKNLNSRIHDHFRKSTEYKSLIHTAINKYGEENFS